jgi:hypothetical protein
LILKLSYEKELVDLMKHSPCWVAGNHSPGLETVWLSWNPKGYYFVHMSLCQFSPIHPK